MLSAAATLAAAATLVALLGQAVSYVSLGSFGDHCEASVAAVTAIFWRGEPLYPALDAAEAYIQIGYGPMLYVLNGALLGLFEPSIGASKVAGPIFLLLALLLAVSSASTRRAGLWMAALLALALAQFAHWSYWNRSDPHLVLMSAVGVFALSLGAQRVRVASTLLAVSMGVAIDLKFTATLYFAPMLVRFSAEHGAFRTAAVVLGAVLVAGAPFALPHVSLAHYLDGLALVGRQGIATGMLAENLELAFFYCLPLSIVILAAGARGPERTQWERRYAWATLASAALLVIVASKRGATAHHYMPLFPVLLDSTARTFHATPPRARRFAVLACVSWAVCASVMAFGEQSHVYTAMQHWARNEVALSEDLKALAAQCDRPSVQMGYAGNRTYSRTFHRVSLVLAGHPYWLDPATLMDFGSVGLAAPDATVAAVSSCKSECFVVPRGEPPFSMRNPGLPNEPLFSPAFVAAFDAAYVRAARSHYFDLWKCRRDSAPERDGS